MSCIAASLQLVKQSRYLLSILRLESLSELAPRLSESGG
jgi:hypothetical protein